MPHKRERRAVTTEDTGNGASPAAVGGRTKTCPSPDNKLTRRKGQQMSRCQWAAVNAHWGSCLLRAPDPRVANSAALTNSSHRKGMLKVVAVTYAQTTGAWNSFSTKGKTQTHILSEGKPEKAPERLPKYWKAKTGELIDNYSLLLLLLLL